MKEAPADPADVLPARMVFGRFELQPHERRLLVDDKPAPPWAHGAFDLLLALVQRSGQLVRKNDLIHHHGHRAQWRWMIDGDDVTQPRCCAC